MNNFNKHNRGFWEGEFGFGLRKLLQNPMGILGITLVALLILSALFADVIAPYDPNQINVPDRFLDASGEHLLGTDEMGRDVFSRALYGGRVALKVALLSTFGALALGVILGVIAGYGPRWLDNGLVLIFDTVRAYPMIIFALAVGPIFGAGIYTVIMIIVVTSVPFYARIVRTAAISMKSSEFIIAEKAIGASSFRIVTVHILPNIMGPLLILASMDIPIVITAEAGLSFLGVGIKPPESSWGLLLDQGYKFMKQSPWLVVAGGIPLILSTLGFTFLGEALRDAFDPKLKQEI